MIVPARNSGANPDPAPMRTYQKLPRCSPPIFLLALGWFFASAALWAQQSATGTIQGRVYNPAAKEYVGNAEVRLEGTTQMTFTENDGAFRFDNVAAGPASITVNFTGYISAKEAFNVTPGLPAVREINLLTTAEAPKKDGEIIQLQAFTVSSEREGNSKAIMAQRRNMNISTSVSSDIFGDVTDGNVGEFLKYLPGVDLDYVESEARGPRLGGMDSQYVGVSFDGMRGASADALRGNGAASRATSFEGFSITSIESIEINRTASPENDADSPAGTVNMKTKRAFDRKGRHFDYNLSMNVNDEEFTFKRTQGPRDGVSRKVRPNYQVGYSESFFDQRFGLLLSASHAESYTEQITESLTYNRSPTAADPRPSVLRQLDFKDGPKSTLKDSLLLTADWKATPHLVLSLNMIYSYYEGEFWNRNFTLIAANDNANVNNGRSTVGGDGMTNVTATRAASGNVNNVATLNNGGGSSAKLTYSRQFAPRFEYKIEGLVVDGSMAFSKALNNYEAIERGFSASDGGGVASGWTATRPDQNSWEWTIRQASGNDWLDYRSFTSTDNRAGGTRVTNEGRLWMTEKWTGGLNARWVVPFLKFFPTALKVGSKWDEESRKTNTITDVNVWSYNGPGGNTTTVSPTNGANVINSWGNWANVGPEYISTNPFEMGTSSGVIFYNANGVQGSPPRASRNAIADLFIAHPELFVDTHTPENFWNAYINNSRDFRQTMTAGYAQTDTRLTSKLQMRFGVRMERTQNALREYDPLTRAQVLAAGYTVNAPGTNNGRPLTEAGMRYAYMSQPRVTRRSQYHNYFPSLLLKYQIRSNFEFQVGANKGIGRPPIDDLTGLWTINESTQIITAPNPGLAPEKHKSIQSRVAYYFGGVSPGQLSIAVAQNEATNFIVSQDYTASEFGVDDPDFASYTFRSKTNSPEMQRTRSMDLSYNQTLGFLPGEYLRGTSVGLTYSRAYASVRRSGLAPHRASARLGYNYKRFNSTLGIIWVDDKPNDGTNYGRFSGAITKLDLTLNWRLSRYASLYVQGRNISNVKDEWYESPPGVQEGQQRYLRGMEEYGANWVFGVKGQF